METKSEIYNIPEPQKKNKKTKPAKIIIVEDFATEKVKNDTSKKIIYCNPRKNSLTAKSGFKAEEIFRNDNIIKKSLEAYFGKEIIDMKKIQGKKYDTRIIFKDNTLINIQNKKIENLGGRGDSFDRRHIKNTFENQFIRKYLTHLSLIRKSKTETFMTEEQKQDFINLCNTNLHDVKQYIKKTLIGENGEENNYWCIMKTDKSFKKINLYVLSSIKLYEFIISSIDIDIKMKKMALVYIYRLIFHYREKEVVIQTTLQTIYKQS